jgi:hypothetical protein
MAENSENILSLTPVPDEDSGVCDPIGQMFMFPSWVFPIRYRGNRLPEHVIARKPVDPLRSSKCISLVTLTPNQHLIQGH